MRLAGAAGLLATSGIHLDLYLTGYRHIPTIGPLFLLQVISGAVLAVAVLALRGRLVALAGAGFAVATLGGYILSLWVGLFGFHEVRTTAGAVAGVIEVVTFAALGSYAAWFAPEPARAPELAQRLVAPGRRAMAPLAVLAAAALVLAVSLATPGSTSTPPAAHGGSSAGTVAATGSMHVAISNYTFIPAHFTVRPGEAIVVTNKDGVDHTFTAIPGSTPVAHFDSGPIAPGTTVRVTAPFAAGSYHFDCAIHPFMTGVLTVA